MQYGYYLGAVDDQYQFLLADGRWAVGYQFRGNDLLLGDHASLEEVEKVR